jgi:hypothetical protein
MTQRTFAQRLSPVIGKPAATLFIESGTDRHFILETIVVAVAAYLGGKFLDAFVDGLGIADPFKALGKEIKESVTTVGDLMDGRSAAPDAAAELDRRIASLEKVASELSAHAPDEPARRQAEAAVRKVLLDKGLPEREAARIATAVGSEMLSAGRPVSGG